MIEADAGLQEGQPLFHEGDHPLAAHLPADVEQHLLRRERHAVALLELAAQLRAALRVRFGRFDPDVDDLQPLGGKAPGDGEVPRVLADEDDPLAAAAALFHQRPGKRVPVGHFEAVEGDDEAGPALEREQQGSQGADHAVGEVHGVDAAKDQGGKGAHRNPGKEPGEVQQRVPAERHKGDGVLPAEAAVELEAVGLNAADRRGVAPRQEQQAHPVLSGVRGRHR